MKFSLTRSVVQWGRVDLHRGHFGGGPLSVDFINAYTQVVQKEWPHSTAAGSIIVEWHIRHSSADCVSAEGAGLLDRAIIFVLSVILYVYSV